jgi:AraC-like DNA-binding protein
MPLQQREFVVTARLIAPRVTLASCVRAYLTRSSLGRPLLPPEQRLNRFPATVYCAVIWFIKGSAQIVEPAPAGADPALPPVLFGGPQTRPFTSYNPGPVHAFTLVFFPDALHALTNIDVSRHLNRIVAFESLFNDAWLDLSRAVMAAPDDDARIALVEHFLEPKWRAARARGAAPGGVLGDWANALGAYAAAAGWGRSPRNLERRIKAWAGQPLRRLRRLSRFEWSYVDAREASQFGHVSWAELAARGGFADQAHLCREVRQVTGHSPAELVRKADTDESYWLYRIWS